MTDDVVTNADVRLQPDVRVVTPASA